MWTGFRNLKDLLQEKDFEVHVAFNHSMNFVDTEIQIQNIENFGQY